MSRSDVTVVIPTLASDSSLAGCLAALRAQVWQDFEVIVVDNSSENRVRQFGIPDGNVRVIANGRNVGYGAAINQAWRATDSRYIAVINDDAQAAPEWLTELVRTAGTDPEIGLVASQVRLDDQRLDSAGMLIAGDGSSKQRGHEAVPGRFQKPEDILLPSGSAALFRREMLEDTGGFDEDFFLYCEDTDLGLRARWRGWRAVYAPKAVVYHRYSHSAGRASTLKAWYVERNRLYLVLKNFPARMLWRVPFASAARYLWHLVFLLSGRGKTAEFARTNSAAMLLWFVLRAHADAFLRLPRLLRERRRIRQRAYMTPKQFARLLSRHSISTREVASR